MRSAVLARLFDSRPRLPSARALLLEEMAAQQGRLVYWLPVFLGCGIAAYFLLTVEPSIVPGVFSVLLIGSAIAVFWPFRNGSERNLVTFAALTGLFWVALGFTAAQIRMDVLAAPVLGKEMRYADVTGTIRDLDRLDEEGAVRMTLGNLLIEDLKPGETPHLVRIKVHDGVGLRNGKRVKVLAGLHPPSPPVSPGAFDFQRYSFFKRLGAVGFAYNRPEIVGADKSGVRELLDNLRQSVAERVAARVAWPDGAIVTALSTGEVAAIPEEDMEAMREAGLAHLLALSGMNVGMIAACVFFLSRLLMAAFPGFALRHPIKKYAAVFGLLAAIGYTLFVGANVPAVRAVLMTGVVMIAIMLDRWALSLRLVALSALAILLVSPEALVGASFQMSFAAVTALICFYESVHIKVKELYQAAGWFRRGALYILGVCVTTIIATGATAPFSLFHFQQLAMYGVLANALAVPIMSFMVMPFIVLSYITIPLGLDFLTLPVAGLGVEWTRAIAHWTTGMDGAVWLVPGWPVSAFALVLSGSLFMLLWRGRLRFAGLVPLVFGAGIAVSSPPPDLLVSSSGRLVAFRGSDGELYASTLRSDRFDRENWARQLGVDEESGVTRWPAEGKIEGRGLVCGELGCRLELKGRRIAVRFSPYGLSEDCAWADLVVSREPVKPWLCGETAVIDRFDVWRDGAHSVRLSGDEIVVHTVAEERGQRPWTGSNSR
ncbi:MAG: ComEC family competence protein [Alphaproteobacteria bacterium]|nr:ComEC family competence protein [Alphaproteobacteria bacterium]